MDIPRAVLNLRAFASGQCHLLETSNQLSDAGVINYTSRSPVGVAGLIAPWNLPLYLLTFKVVIFEQEVFSPPFQGFKNLYIDFF